MTDTPQIPLGENPAETMRKVMTEIGNAETLYDGQSLIEPHLVTLPSGRSVHDLTKHHIAAAEHFQPTRRRGTAHLQDLQSLIDWSNRFKGDTSALFANADMSHPTLTCIADYHAAGPHTLDVQGDRAARHCAHRAIYDFPISDEFRDWLKISGKPLGKDEMGNFIEDHAKDIMDPTPAILAGKITDKNASWENRLIETAAQIEGKFGQLTQLLAMSKKFQVFETSDLKVVSNRDTGEAEIQFLNEHKTATGEKLNIPNLIIIAIPVFEGGALYRMPVRFRYRKSGNAVNFILSVYNPEKAFKSAFDEAVTIATTETELPVFTGKPES